MSYLKTLEGVTTTRTGGDINDLFDVNDTLGCLLYGPEMWNRIKSFACNRALELLANKSDFAANLSKIAGRKNYIIKNDILDRLFGFNHQLGCELYGAEEWGEFVNECKSGCPELGSIGGAFKSLVNPKGTFYPENWSAGGLLQFLLAPGLTNVSDAFAQIGSKTQTQKAAESQADTYRNNARASEAHAAQVEQSAAERVEQAKREFSAEYARTKASEDSINEKNKELQYQLNTNPEYIESQRNKWIIICGAGLLALAIMRR